MYNIKSFWDTYYAGAECPLTFDWYVEDVEFMNLIRHFAHLDRRNRSLPVLVLGCGNSCLSTCLCREGHACIDSVDFSEIVIDKMRKQCHDFPAVRWKVLDVADEHVPLNSNHYDLVLDKGTFDAVWYGWRTARIRQMLWNVLRVLRLGGKYVLLTASDRYSALSLFEAFWTVEHFPIGFYDVYVVTKFATPTTSMRRCLQQGRYWAEKGPPVVNGLNGECEGIAAAERDGFVIPGRWHRPLGKHNPSSSV
jgi:SAM-dependent methyltransferase